MACPLHHPYTTVRRKPRFFCICFFPSVSDTVCPQNPWCCSSGHSHCLYNSISKSPHTILGYFLYYDLSNSLAVLNTVYQRGEITQGEALTSYIVCLPLCLSLTPNYTANDFREEIKISVDASGNELEILGAWHLINSHRFTLDSFVNQKIAPMLYFLFNIQLSPCLNPGGCVPRPPVDACRQHQTLEAVLPYTCILMIKFNLQIKYSNRLATIISNKIEHNRV